MLQFTDELLCDAWSDGAEAYRLALAEGQCKADAVRAGNEAAAATLGVSPEHLPF